MVVLEFWMVKYENQREKKRIIDVKSEINKL